MKLSFLMIVVLWGTANVDGDPIQDAVDSISFELVPEHCFFLDTEGCTDPVADSCPVSCGFGHTLETWQCAEEETCKTGCDTGIACALDDPAIEAETLEDAVIQIAQQAQAQNAPAVAVVTIKVKGVTRCIPQQGCGKMTYLVISTITVGGVVQGSSVRRIIADCCCKQRPAGGGRGGVPKARTCKVIQFFMTATEWLLGCPKATWPPGLKKAIEDLEKKLKEGQPPPPPPIVT